MENMDDTVAYTFDSEGYVIIDDFLYEDVVNELHDLAVNHIDIECLI